MKYKVLLILFSFCLIVSALIASGATFGSICTSENSGCALVQSSQYGMFLGIKLGVIGVIGFLCLVMLLMIQLRKPKKELARFIDLAVTLAGIVAWP